VMTGIHSENLFYPLKNDSLTRISYRKSATTLHKTDWLPYHMMKEIYWWWNVWISTYSSFNNAFSLFHNDSWIKWLASSITINQLIGLLQSFFS
jgi:hypothetical protein